MNLNRISIILFTSFFFIVVIYLASFDSSNSDADPVEQEVVVQQDQLISNEVNSLSKKKATSLQETDISQPRFDDLLNSEVLKIQDPDLIEIPGFPKLVEINIGNELITREFSSMEIRNFPAISLENSDQYINALEPLVEAGSGPAAYRLRDLLLSCLTAPRDETAYRQNERTILEENRSTHGMSVDQHLTFNKALYLRCKGVHDESLKQENLDALFDLAVENGSKIALSELARSHLSKGEYEEAGIRLKELWDSGDQNSGGTLGFIYANTDFDGSDPTRPNLVKSYAYKFAQELVNTAARETSSYYRPPLNSIGSGGGQSARDLAVTELTPQQVREADRLAKSLIESNTNCCVWIWSNN